MGAARQLIDKWRIGDSPPVAHAPTARHYRTSLDRAGFALALGAGLGGAFATLLVALGRPPTWLALPAGFAAGAIVASMAAVALGGPLWIVAHRSGRRGPWTAMAIGGLSGFALFLAGQTHGLGLLGAASVGSRAAMYRWTSAAATSAVLAALSAMVALAMWRTAYRRG